MTTTNHKTSFIFLSILCGICLVACKSEGPFDFPFENAGGYVIGKEECAVDASQDYWLVDLSVFPQPNTYGDTLTLNGTLYSHVVKTKGLAPQFKTVGAKVDLDFKFATGPVETYNCTVSKPKTYTLKVIEVQDQAELR